MANLVPKVNNVGSLGTASKVWNNIHVSTTSFANSSITEDSGSIKLKSLPVLVEGALTVAGSLSISAQAGSLSLNSQKIINLGTPTLSADAATKGYVDSVLQGLDVKDSVRAATTANGALDTAFANGQAIDGVTLATNDRILIKDQTTASENGIYIVQASGAPARAADLAASSSAAGIFVFVEEGTTNADSGFVCTSNASADTVGTHSLAFSQFSGAGQITAGNGLAKSGNALSVNVDDSSIEIYSDSLRVKAGGVTSSMIASGAVINSSLASSAITGQTAETSIADDDLILISDTSASGALRKMTKANFVSGLGGGGSTTLSGLTDTAISGPSAGQILVYDGSNSFDNVSISGDAALSSAGVLTIAANAIEGSMLNNNIVSGLSDIGADLVITDEIIVSDNGTIKRTDLSRLSTLMAGAGLADSSGTLALNIDGLSALGGAGLHQTEDHFAFSDNGTEKKITFSNLQDAIFADVSGDATIAAGGSLTIGSGAVEGSMLHNNVISGQSSELTTGLASTDELLVSDAGVLKRMDVSVLQSYLQSNLTFTTALTQENVEDFVGGMVSGNTETFIAVSYDDSDGTLDFVVPVKDEDDMTSNSAAHLATQQSIKAYVDAQVAGGGLNIDGYNALGGTGLHQTEDHFVFSDNGTEKKITFSNLQDAIFADVSGDATVAAGGALTIAAGSVENSMLAGSIANAKLANSSVTIGSTSTALGATSSAIAGLTQLDVDNIRVNGNTISSTDSNGNMILSPNGTGKVIVDGDGSTSNGGVSIENGLIDLKNGGTVSKIKFYCESNNAHAQTLQGAPHSASASNTLVLPAAAGTLVGTGDSGTVTNTMLAGSITASKLNNAIFADLETLGAPASDGQFIVATGAGAFAYESANTARTSLGLGTGSSPSFTSLTLSGQASALAMNSQKITGLATPTADGDAATKAYVDGVAQGLSAKDSVRAATTANGTLGTAFANGQAVDGVTLATGDRILIKNQSTGSENGIYVVNASGAPTRAVDFDANAEVAKGAFVFVEEGTTNADSGFVLTTDGSITLGSTALAFTQFSGAGQVTAGSALTKSGSTLNVAVDDSSIEISSDALRVKAAGITNAMLADDAVGADELAANAVVNASVVDGAIKADKLDIDGSTDIGADLVDADLIVVDDGAAGTNRKSALSRIKKYIYSAMSGDATSSDAGVLTLAADSVEGSMLNNNVISGQTAMTGDVADADELLISDNGTIKRADFSVVRDAVFNDVSGDATIAAGGALTIAASSVEGSMLNASAITGQTAETSIADDDLILISDTSASGALRKMTKANFVSGLGSSFASSDITGQTEHSTNLANDDYLVVYDTSASALKKISKANFFKGNTSTTTPEFWQLNIQDFTLDTSGGTSSQYLRLKMNDNENAGEPIFLVENSSSSSSGGQIALGIREYTSAGNSVGDGDTLGIFRFQETQSNGSADVWAEMHGNIIDHANNYGNIDLKVRTANDTLTTGLQLGTGSGGTFVDIKNHDGSDSGLKLNGTLVTASAAELNKLDGATVTTSEINLLDGGTSVGSSITIADADGFIINDNGTMKSIPASDLKTYIGAGAADDLTAGDAAVTLTTTSGNITIDAQANDSDIIFAGTDNNSHISMLTLDGSDAGTAIFNHNIKMQNDGAILFLGTNADVSLTHVHDAGLKLNSTRYLSFNDAGTKVWSSEDGQLDLASDGTMVDSVLVNAASGGIKLNAGLDGNAAAIHLDSASGVTIAGGDENDSVYIENSPLLLEQISAPSTTTNKLYNVGGTLTWNGSAVTTGGGGGGSQLPPEVKTVSTTATLSLTPSNSSTYNSIEVIYTCTGSSAYTVTLPTAASIEGKKIHVKRLATANITVDGDGSETIDGSATFVLSTQYEAITLISDGTNWIII